MPDTEDTLSLGDELRSVARSRILRAACAVLARRGLNCTVDEVAVAAGVSRRTVFRHFPTHGRLLAAALTEILDRVEDVVPAPPSENPDIDAWLFDVTLSAHRFSVEQVGQLFWDIYADRTNAPEVREVFQRAAPARHRMAQKVAQDAWRMAGRRGSPPAWVTSAFLLHLSGFAHRGVQGGGKTLTTEDTARTSAKVLSVVLAAALEEQKSG